MAMVKVASTSDVEPEEAMRVVMTTSAGTQVPVAVVRDSDGSWHAIGDTCSHGNYSLSEGEIEDGTLECWKHGSAFDIRTGKPNALPAVNPVPVFAIDIDGTDVLVDVDTTL
ncbi:MAG: non-heme iron oxygenase ferredoxin subunit [Actinomycetaceae bacterium]|nr:non-heme iron oxygenase ferredoxin subunit [Actinomycetaceae bacterium]MDY6083236.1 non-heme iron oxygenase ferredoxin subunit [Actinomycetaceae bacterium]